MTAPNLSPAEAARVAEFEAAPEPPEIVVERVARAIFGFMPPISYNLRVAMARSAAQAAIHALQPSRAAGEGDPTAAVEHPSNPDQLMARALGVCWHSPTSDRWPCGGVR